MATEPEPDATEIDWHEQLFVRQRVSPGTSPGTIIVDPEAPPPRITRMEYSPDHLVEQTLGPPFAGRRVAGVEWINVDGLGDAATLQAIAAAFDMHRLMLEDIVNVHQRPKVEEYGDTLYVVARMHLVDGASEQVSFVVSEHRIITFQETVGDCFEPVRRRIRSASGRIRSAGADYLLYALLDSLIDSYFPVLEHLGDEIEGIETAVLEASDDDIVGRVHELRNRLLTLRRVVQPAREAVAKLMREDTPLVTDPTRVYLRDCQDHLSQQTDLIENLRELLNGVLDVHLSNINNQMHGVMKVLTIVSTVFIPLTFIAGVYGMNFDREASPWNMPELGWWLGYPACLLLMTTLGGGMLLYFYKQGWLGRRRAR